MKQVLRSVVLASAGISLSATLPLAADALHGPLAFVIAVGALVVLLSTELDTIWVILAAAALSLIASAADVLRAL